MTFKSWILTSEKRTKLPELGSGGGGLGDSGNARKKTFFFCWCLPLITYCTKAKEYGIYDAMCSPGIAHFDFSTSKGCPKEATNRVFRGARRPKFGANLRDHEKSWVLTVLTEMAKKAKIGKKRPGFVNKKKAHKSYKWHKKVPKSAEKTLNRQKS